MSSRQHARPRQASPDLPRIFLIGAAKSGTTALALAMGRHPAMYLPPEKEPGFFSDGRCYRRGLDWYRSRYVAMGDEQTGIDASTMYLYSQDAPARFASAYPDPAGATFFAMLRNPVDRAYSAYWQAASFGWIPKSMSFEAALAAEPSLLGDKTNRESGRTVGAFLAAGRYAEQLQRWYRALGDGQVTLLLKDDFDHDPANVHARILDRLGLDPHSSMRPDLVANRARLPRSTMLNALCRGRHPLLRRLREPLPRDLKLRLKRLLDRHNQREIAYPPMRAETRAMLLERFAPENEALASLTGLDLSRWSH